MSDLTVDTACRICLEDGLYPIFESNQHFDGLHSKFPEFMKVKIRDIVGYPRNICFNCKNELELMNNFINKFEETCKKLQSKLLTVKLEVYPIDINNHNDMEPFSYGLRIENIMKYEPKVEIKDPVELLESLSHNLTITKIKVGSKSTTIDTMDIENKNTKKLKQGKSKPATSIKAKNVAKKPMNVLKKPPNLTTDVGNRHPLVSLNSQVKISQIDLEVTPPEPTLKLCDLCGETFHAADELAFHKVKRHSEGPFKCPICPKVFAHRKNLHNHKSAHREKIKDSICDICGKAFEKRRLMQHIRLSHMKDPNKKRVYKLHKCRFCVRTYTYKVGVIIHERSVHTGERPAVCDLCNSAFYHKVYLNEHMRIHTGVCPYECPICGCRYKQRGNMKSHMRNHKISELSAKARSELKPNYFKYLRP